MRLLQPTQFIKVIIVSLALIMLASCSSKPSSLSIIPESTNVVTVVDVYSLIKKGELNELEQFDLFKTFKKEIRNENKKVSRMMQNVIDDPTETGLDFTNDLLMFYVNEAKDEQYYAMAMDLKNEEKFTVFIEDLLDKGGVSFDVENEKSYKYTIVNKDVAFAWDKNKVICLTSKNYESRKNFDLTISTLFGLKENNQITQNKDFTTFYNNKKDISLWFSTNLLEDNYQYKRMTRELDFDIADNYVAAHLNFENNNMSMQWKLFPNDDVKKMVEEDPILNTNFNSDLLSFLPENSLANASVSMNPMAYYNMLKSENGFDKMESKFENEMGFTLKEFIGSFKGSAVFNLIDIKEVEYTYQNYYSDTVTKTEPLPIMGLAFDISSNTYIKQIIEKIPENDLQKRSDYYEIKIDNRYDMYLAFNSNTCYFTNDKASVKAFKDGGLKSGSLLMSNQVSNFKNNAFYASMNLDFDTYPNTIKKEITKAQNSREGRVFDMWSEFASSLELKQIDNYTMQLDLKTKDNNKNSLNNMLSLIDKSYNSYMGL
ncbi:DUF4836 family protein [Winogradskyella eximia]|uniref:DUF4836 family protein n=1 Tax=Winogradskyella eximia TaxID=262006 RepID=UPI0024923E00|nr:DUF4836 family protein [Winogradskyella eximia]